MEPEKQQHGSHERNRLGRAGHAGHQGHGGRKGHGGHHAMMVADFRRRFWISLVLTIPILLLSPMLQHFAGLGEERHRICFVRPLRIPMNGEEASSSHFRHL